MKFTVCFLSWYMGMTLSTNEHEKLTTKSDISTAVNDMRSGSFMPSRLTSNVYHKLSSFLVYCMSSSAVAVLIFLLLFWYYGRVLLLSSLLLAVLGELQNIFWAFIALICTGCFVVNCTWIMIITWPQ